MEELDNNEVAVSTPTQKKRGRPRKDGSSSSTPASAVADSLQSEPDSPVTAKRVRLSAASSPDPKPEDDEFAVFYETSDPAVPGSVEAAVRDMLLTIAPKFEITLPTTQDEGVTRMACPIPGCAKTFLNIEGIMYHGKTTVHPVADALSKSGSSFDIQTLSKDSLPLPVKVVWRAHAFDKKSRDVQFIVGFGKERPRDRRATLTPRKSEHTNGDASTPKRGDEDADTILWGIRDAIQTGVPGRTAPVRSPSDVLPKWQAKSTPVRASNSPKNSIQLSIENQDISLAQFAAKNLDQTFVLNVGPGPRALSWCPSNGPESAQFIAIASLSNSAEASIRLDEKHSGPGIIQIWNIRLGPSKDTPFVALYVHHDSGICWDLAWLPTCSQANGRLGILAAAFSDQSVKIVAVPEPQSPAQHVSLTPVRVLNFPHAIPTSLSWSFNTSSADLFIGLSNGHLAHFSFPPNSTPNSTPNSPPTDLRGAFPLHHGAIRKVSTCPFDDTKLATCGEDGNTFLWDTRDLNSPLAATQIRHIQVDTTWALSPPAHLHVDGNTVRAVVTTDRFHEMTSSRVTEHSGNVWGISGSLCHAGIASVGADGRMIVMPNMVRVRRNRVKPVQVLHVTEGERGRVEVATVPVEFVPTAGNSGEKLPPARAALLKVQWCPNKWTSNWMVTCSEAGTAHLVAV